MIDELKAPAMRLYLALSVAFHLLCYSYFEFGRYIAPKNPNSVVFIDLLSPPTAEPAVSVVHRNRDSAAERSFANVQPARLEDMGKTETPGASLERPAAKEAVDDARTINSYLGSIILLINREKTYPLIARRKGQQGKVVLELTINRAGGLQSVKLSEPSPFEELNQAAIDIVRSINRYPPLPADFLPQELRLKIPVEYRLR